MTFSNYLKQAIPRTKNGFKYWSQYEYVTGLFTNFQWVSCQLFTTVHT